MSGGAQKDVIQKLIPNFQDRPASPLDFNMLDDEENDMEVQLLERPAREARQAREQSEAREVEPKKKEEEFDPVLEELRKKQTIVEHYDGKFDCSICLGVVFQPVQSSACRHIFCRLEGNFLDIKLAIKQL